MNFHLSSLFSEEKAAETAVYFLLRASNRGANITLLKLMKLMYLAERLSYEKYGFPIIGDQLVSMPHGPVLSSTLNLMVTEQPGAWGKLIEKSGRDMSLLPGQVKTVADLRQLSDADVEVLDMTWARFGNMSATTLERFTHDPNNCPEWQDPDGSSRPIELKTLLDKLGYTPEDVAEIAERTRTQAWLNSKLAEI
jgi:uncharacterized phage-associated protein